MEDNSLLKKERNSNIELLRIILMLLIVMHHYVVHGRFKNVPASNQVLLDIMYAGARMAINIFILITGYFQVYAKTVKNKLFKMWTEIFFYSFTISIIFLILGLQKISLQYVLRTFFPIITCRHNFVTTFFMFYIFIPYINMFINSISQKQLITFLGLYVLLISIHPTIMSITKLYHNNVYSYISWMFFVYCIGAYIKLYGLPFRRIHYAIGGGMGYLIILFMTCYLEHKITWLPRGYTANNQCNFLVLLTSICIFWTFLGLNFKSKLVNFIASSNFAVLLIHDNPNIRSVLWTKIAHVAVHGKDPKLFIWAAFTVIAVFIICSIVDKIIKFLLIKPLWRKLK